jgi:SAM-dependent methyltransferase
LIEFYTSGYREASRLERPKSRLEFLRAQELLRERLPAIPARILDVGGGTGAHAAWLAGDGYEVTLVDIVPAHVDAALELAAGLKDGFDARVGDARDLKAEDGSVDACLLLGPLYHLPDAADRALALTEAVRVTRRGGVVCAAAISRYAWPLYALRDGDRLTAERVASIKETFANGQHDPVGQLPAAFSHSPHELASELDVAGLEAVEVLGIEGPGWPLFTPDLTEERASDLLDDAIAAARLCDGHPEMTAVSAHLLACGRRS